MKKTIQKPASFLTVYEIRNEDCRRQHKNFLSCFNAPDHACQHLNLSHPQVDLSYVFDWETTSNEAIKVNVYQEKLPASLTQETCQALGLLMPFAYKDTFSFSFNIYCAKVFKHLLETRQAYWQKPFSLPLTWSAPKTILFNWKMEEDGAQCLDYVEQDIRFFVLDELIYLNHQTGECGIMETNVSRDYLKHYQEMVSYAPSAVESLTTLCQKHDLPLPQKIKAIAKKTPKIKPCLHLGGTVEEGEWVPTAELSFCYGKHSIDCFSTEDKIYELIDDQWYYFKRNQALEYHYMQQLDALPLYFYQYLLEYSSLQANRFTHSSKTWQQSIHLLLDSDWRIVVDLGFPVALPDFDYIPKKTLTPDGLHHLVLTQKSRAEA